MTAQIRDAEAPTRRVDRFPNHEQKQYVMLPIHTKLQVRTLTMRPPNADRQSAESRDEQIHRSERGRLSEFAICASFSKSSQLYCIFA